MVKTSLSFEVTVTEPVFPEWYLFAETTTVKLPLPLPVGLVIEIQESLVEAVQARSESAVTVTEVEVPE